MAMLGKPGAPYRTELTCEACGQRAAVGTNKPLGPDTRLLACPACTEPKRIELSYVKPVDAQSNSERVN